MEFTTAENGVKVVINPASLDDAFKLKSSIQKAFKDNNLDPQQEISSGNILPLIMAMDGSTEVFDGIFACLAKSTYGGVKITKEVFESEQSRSDLYEVFYYCLKVNIYPFFRSLSSLLNNLFAGKKD